MRKLAALFVLLGTGIAGAQVSYDTVTATVTDPLTHPYANAAYSIMLVTPNGAQVDNATTPNGQVYNAQPLYGNLDANGVLNVQLVPNNILTPTNTLWRISLSFPQDRNILTYTAPWTLNYTTAITGPVDLSSQISALANQIEFVNLKTGQNTLTAASGVNQIVAGTNCTVTPTSGIGTVTVNCTAGTGATLPSSGLVYATSTVTSEAATSAQVVDVANTSPTIQFGTALIPSLPYLSQSASSSTLVGLLNTSPSTLLATALIPSLPYLSQSAASSTLVNLLNTSPSTVLATALIPSLPYLPLNGNAATASALAAAPTVCQSGEAPVGVQANGNATGCQTYVIPAEGGASVSGTTTLNTTTTVKHLLLTGNVTGVTIAAGTSGYCFTMHIVENSTGGWTWAWPSNMVGGMVIDDIAGAVNAQRFCWSVADNEYEATDQGTSVDLFNHAPAPVTFANLTSLPSSSWSTAGGACCGANVSGTDNTAFNVAAPALSSSAVQLNSTGGTYNVQAFVPESCSALPGGNCTTYTHILADVWTFVPSSSATLQGMEGPNVVTYTGTYQYYPSLQCATNSGSTTPSVVTWNVWDSATGHWIPTNISCATYFNSKNTWHHIQIEYLLNFGANTMGYGVMALDGQQVFNNPLNATYGGESDTSGSAIKPQYQIDTTSTVATADFYIDKYNVTVY